MIIDSSLLAKKPSAILDACVLFQSATRDLLLWLAYGGMYQAHWTKDIQKEWLDNLLEVRPDLSRERLKKTQEMMNLKIKHGLVKNYQNLIGELKLPDEKDRHVLAAAIKSESEFIVTNNLRDFPSSALNLHGVKAISPDNFASTLFDSQPKKFIIQARTHRAGLNNPPKSVEEYLSSLEEIYGFKKTVARLRKHENEL